MSMWGLGGAGQLGLLRSGVHHAPQHAPQALPPASVMYTTSSSLAGHLLQHSACGGALHAQVLERLLHPPPVLKAKGVDAWGKQGAGRGEQAGWLACAEQSTQVAPATSNYAGAAPISPAPLAHLPGTEQQLARAH